MTKGKCLKVKVLIGSKSHHFHVQTVSMHVYLIIVEINTSQRVNNFKSNIYSRYTNQHGFSQYFPIVQIKRISSPPCKHPPIRMILK